MCVCALQAKYKEGLDSQRPRYNPLECVSFKHTQAAAALASQVRGSPAHATSLCDACLIQAKNILEPMLVVQGCHGNLRQREKRRAERTIADAHISVSCCINLTVYTASSH